MSTGLLLVLSVWILPAGGRPGQIELPPSVACSSWTAAEGLPQNSVSGICQDTAGFLWIGTYGGLARFDGRRFEVLDVGNRPDLPGNRFLRVIADRDDTLWLHVGDVGLLRYRDDRFTRIDTPATVREVTIGPRGVLWAAFDRGVGRLHDGRFEWVKEGPVRALLATADGALWGSTPGGRLFRLHDEGESVFDREAGLPGEPLSTLFQDTRGILWGGGKAGVWRFTDSAITTFARVPGAPADVQAIAEDERGRLWFGCQDGLVRWDPETDSGVVLLGGDHGCLLVDDRGNLWSGSTKGTGLKCIRTGPLRDATAALGLPIGNAWSITEGPRGSVVVNADHTLVETRDGRPVSRELRHITRCALLDREGDLWVAQTSGLLRFRGEVQTEYGESDGLSGPVRALFESRDGTLWVGTSQGLHRREGSRFERFGPEELANIRSLLEDETTGALWVGTQEGLVRIAGGSFAWLTSRDGLSPGSVRTLHQDSDGILWVGTYGGGLSRIEKGAITRYTRENGLADNFLACVLEDDAGRFWINSNVGPFVVRRADLNRVARGELAKVACVTFTPEEGAREANGGNQPSGWRGPDGRMWFPTIEGVTVADPVELPLDEAPPTVRIEALEVREDRALDARFTALGFSSPQRLRIQYRLPGRDPEWVESDGRREVHYSYVPPGDHEFRVRARNGFGPWSPVATRSFEIPHHFHETTTFVVVVALLVALGVFGLAERRVRRSRARTGELLQLMEEREEADRALRRSRAELRRLSRELLAGQEAERRFVSRELHDDVTQRLAALAMQAEIAESRLEAGTGQTHESLRRIVESAQQLAGDVQQLSRRLHPVGLRTLGLSDAIRQECDAFARRTGVELELEGEVPSDEIAEDTAVAVFRILQEGLHNIEKHARTDRVRVALALESGDLVVTVSDRGRGFEPETDAEAGLGLITMRERAASIDGVLSVDSRPGEGTTIHLRAPGRRKRE